MNNARNRVVNYSSDDTNVSAKLLGFKINSAELDPTHKLWLDGHVIPLLLSGGSITLIGMASRSGANEYNKSLSEKRATGVLTYLQQTTGQPFGKRVVANRGVGEKTAALAGQDDGTEDAAYRAVLLVAWNKPLPPPPPKPVQQPIQLLKKITSRTHEVVEHPSMGRGTIHDGEMGVKIAGIFNDFRGKNEKKNTKEFFPADWVIDRVTESSIVEKTSSVAGTTTVYRTELHYHYGPFISDWVLLQKISVTTVNGKKGRPSASKYLYPSKEVWKQTTAPWAEKFR